MLITPLGQRIVVRCARKAIWMPTAPSKLFRIAEHTFYDKEEMIQIKQLEYAYKAQLSSIGKYMREEFYVPAQKSGGLPTDFIEKELEEEKKIRAENERINAEVAKLKDDFFEKQYEKMKELLIEEKMAKEEDLIEAGEKIDSYIQEKLADPDFMVVPDNLDAMIERAMEKPVSYEFCIDKSGKTHKQRTLVEAFPHDGSDHKSETTQSTK